MGIRKLSSHPNANAFGVQLYNVAAMGMMQFTFGLGNRYISSMPNLVHTYPDDKIEYGYRVIMSKTKCNFIIVYIL